MMGTAKNYRFFGDPTAAEQEYSYFKRCLPQLIDSDEITGDLEGRWIIFMDGWVYGLASYDSALQAEQFARQMFQGDRVTYIVVDVDLKKHVTSPLDLLGNALSEIEFEEADDE